MAGYSNEKKMLQVMLLFFFVLCSPDEKSQTLIVKKCKMLKWRLITATVMMMPAVKSASVILLI